MFSWHWGGLTSEFLRVLLRIGPLTVIVNNHYCHLLLDNGFFDLLGFNGRPLFIDPFKYIPSFTYTLVETDLVLILVQYTPFSAPWNARYFQSVNVYSLNLRVLVLVLICICALIYSFRFHEYVDILSFRCIDIGSLIQVLRYR